ncbi:SPRY domain-containing protein [Clostridium algidicarnis]|uniref:SPRY domain-containing protein n=1 Tax=Clostridium algidicarnis TaxID=37659 RepID=UPI001C0E4C39|nr:SPRY domain-containing protein [Clostridium algidicarnis]MBU3205114.1 hypothetical protein [Clostridium algidicarnis]MBU3213267.1 hypothetical protein [Clostridium algidicarnis]MBU3223838.1 hypothetical protein [Clostridium algidicarnis]
MVLLNNNQLKHVSTTSSYSVSYANSAILTTDKRYCEVTPLKIGNRALFSIGYSNIGISTTSAYRFGTSSNEYSYSATGQKYNTSYTDYASLYVENDVIGILLDNKNKTLEFFKNGVSQGVAFTNVNLTKPILVVGGYDIGWSFSANFGASPFIYKIPNGSFSYDGNQMSLNKFMIKQNNQYYSIKSELYSDSKFQPITELQVKPALSKADYDNFGIEDLNLLTQNMTVGTETFRPIDKFTGEIEIYKYTEK